MEFINFIGLIVLVWMFVDGAAPVQFIKEQLNIHNDTKSNNTWILLLSKLINCALCSGFWIGLIYYQSLELAAIVSVTSEIFYRFITKLLK
jgi:hypothetical protein